MALTPALAGRVAASGVTSVVVDRVHLSEGRSVSIYDGRFIGSHGEVGVGAGSTIGYSEFLEAGTHEDVDPLPVKRRLTYKAVHVPFRPEYLLMDWTLHDSHV